MTIDLLFRPDALQQQSHHPSHDVVLEDGNYFLKTIIL